MAAARSVSLMRSRAWIAGSWTPASGGQVFPVYDPCTGKKIIDVPDMGAEDAENAVMEAHKSKKMWGNTLAGVGCAVV